MSGGVLLGALGLVLALIIGVGAERVRQAHDHWLSYRSRAMKNLALEMKESVRTVVWLVALTAVIYFAIRLR